MRSLAIVQFSKLLSFIDPPNSKLMSITRVTHGNSSGNTKYPTQLDSFSQEIADLYEMLLEKGICESRVMTDTSLALDDKAGLVKCWFVYVRRRRVCELLQTEDRRSGSSLQC